MKILIISDFELPDKSASASRAFEFAKIFKHLGHQVEIIGTNYSKENNSSGIFSGFKYENIGGEIDANKFTYRFKRLKKVSREIENKVNEINSESKIDAIFLVGYIWDYHKLFFSISKKLNIKLMSDVVEWYDKKSFVGIFAPIKFIQNRIGLIFLLKKIKNLVCISTLLEEYYKSKQCNVVRVPTILDMEQYGTVTSNENNKLIMAYAGMPRKKDSIFKIIESISLLSEKERRNIEFRIYGPTIEELKLSGCSDQLLEEVSSSVVCKGRIAKEKVVDELKNSDFTVLLRPNARYANAGFPTKVGESLASGVPVIANLTSDLSLYLEDNKNAIIVETDSSYEFSKALKKALKTSQAELYQMKKNAYTTADKFFDFRNYIEPMRVFLSNLV